VPDMVRWVAEALESDPGKKGTLPFNLIKLSS
jgi:hypothetical protein